MMSWLFGAYWLTGPMGRMAFMTYRGAKRYRATSIDPYVRVLRGPIVFTPGKLFRRATRKARA